MKVDWAQREEVKIKGTSKKLEKDYVRLDELTLISNQVQNNELNTCLINFFTPPHL